MTGTSAEAIAYPSGSLEHMFRAARRDETYYSAMQRLSGSTLTAESRFDGENIERYGTRPVQVLEQVWRLQNFIGALRLAR